MPFSRSCSCNERKADRFLATSSTPEVSRSRRCTSSRKRASGRSARKPSMTPKLNPLPPCTAVPEGLLSTRMWSSSYKMTSVSAATFCKFGEMASSSRSATRTGGIRTMSPSSSLYSGLMRFLFTRTSPLRKMR